MIHNVKSFDAKTGEILVYTVKALSVACFVPAHGI